jgi:hypothetical protein
MVDSVVVSNIVLFTVLCALSYSAAAEGVSSSIEDLKQMLISEDEGIESKSLSSKRVQMERKRICGEVDSDCLTVRHNGVVLKVSSGLDFTTHTVVDLLARLPCWFGPRRSCTSSIKQDGGGETSKTEEDKEKATKENHRRMLDSAFEAVMEKEEVVFKLRGSELRAVVTDASGTRKNVLKSVNPRMGEVVDLVKAQKKRKHPKARKPTDSGSGSASLKVAAVSDADAEL